MAQGITEAEVTEWTKELASNNLTLAVAAANAYVGALPSTQNLSTGKAWPPAIRLGAILLASRLIRRRNSPGGVEAVTDVQVAYTARWDPDIARLLGLDGSQKPAVG